MWLPVEERKLSVSEKKMQEAAQSEMKTIVSHLFMVLQWPSFVNRGAKIVKPRMVAVGRSILSRAVPLRTKFRMYISLDSSVQLSESVSESEPESIWGSIRSFVSLSLLAIEN